MSIAETPTKPESKSMSESAFSPPHQPEEEFALRTVSKSAIFGVVMAIFCLISMWVCWILWENWTLSMLFSIIPIAMGLLAYLKIKKYPEEYSGKSIALASLGLGAFCFVTSIGSQAYVYNTEVPDGYVRMGWDSLKIPARDRSLYSVKAEEFDGKKVFIKGYVRPDDKKTGLQTFIMVPDFGTCCFGEKPKITDCIGVKIITDDTVDVNFRIRKIAGEFKLHKNSKRTRAGEVDKLVYELHADYVK